MEGKLAETAPKRPLALTIGAAAATLVVIFGVLTGPAIVSCFNSEDGLGLCLRGKMAEVGLVPPLPEPAIAEAETAAGEASPAIAEEAVSPEPELDVTPPVEAVQAASADAADDVIAATFGLLRAEPDGSVVIAGSGTPGSKVEVFANGQLLGKVDVEASGDWVFVPDTPLDAGDLEITLGEEGKTGTAEQSFIVVLNEDRTTQPLVVASTPGQASEVLQGLTAPAVAAADAPASEPETAEVALAAPVEQPAAKTQDAAVAIPAGENAVAVEEPAAAIAEEPASAVAATTEDEPAIAGEPETDIVAPTEPLAPEPAAPQPEAAPAVETAVVADAPLATEPEAVVAAVPEAPVAETPATAIAPLADMQPTIDAIELEGARTFFAGAGPAGGIIRLYVDDGFVADAAIAEGRWLVEAGPVLGKPSQRVRVDLIQPGTGAVLARSEVDFVVDLPAPAASDEQIAVADADVPDSPEATASEPAVADAAPAAEPAAPAEAPVAAPANAEAVPPAEAVTQPEPDTQPASQPASEPAPVPAVEPAPQPQPTPAPVTEPVVPKMVAVSLGDPEAQRFASGKAIIRRGDNLWTIARRVYGEGVKYTTIYQANNAHIRDPDRIYPGQVFDLPAGQ